MKYDCIIIRDLLPLFADGLCSDETDIQVAAHIDECEECRLALSNYHAKLEESVNRTTPKPEAAKDLEPLKKARKKLRRIRLKAWICGILAVLLLGGCGFLLHGDMTSSHFGFQSLLQTAQVHHIISEYQKGNVKPLVDAMYLRTDDIDNYLIYGHDDWSITLKDAEDSYRKMLTDNMTEQWKAQYSNRTSETEYNYEFDEAQNSDTPFCISVTIHDGQDILDSIIFEPAANRQFIIDSFDGAVLKGLIDAVPSKNFGYAIGYNLTNRYLDGIHEDLTSGAKRLPTLEEYNANANSVAEYAEDVAEIRPFMVSFCNIDAEQILHLYEADWHPRRIIQNIEDYDAEQKAWTYRIQIECEHQSTGTVCIFQQKVLYSNNEFHTIDGEEPVLIGGEDERSAEVNEMFKHMLLQE